MIWYLVSIATYLYRRILFRIQNNQHAIVAPSGTKAKAAVSFSEETHGYPSRKTRPNHKLLQRKMSFAGGVDGHGQCIAVLTSGGDAQGMNAAIRAVVRMAIYAGARTFAVYWGYQGLVDGGSNIKEMFWDDVNEIIQKGGTVIGSARCQDFRSRDGRLKAAYNLIQKGITNLVVIGGDGSLTGADTFRSEWKSLLDELVTLGKITQEAADTNAYLNVVGMVGSIDNDFCGTDMTIGADTALHRIIDNVDAIMTTAESHQRAFVLEVMGRHCGYLALIAGISCGADWVFIPEWPLEAGWQDDLCDNLQRTRHSGRLLSILIIAEGAQDIHGNAVTANDIKELLSTRLKFDTRVTILGHVQRGGIPSAFDRLLATRFGAEAALAVLEADETSEASVVCLNGQQIVKKPLHQCVAMCKAVKEAFDAKDFAKVIQLRGLTFQSNLSMYKILKHVSPPKDNLKKSGYTFAVMNIGAPAGGMNAAVAGFVRSCLYKGHTVLGIADGFEGLIQNQVHCMCWSEVDKWSGIGGSVLGVTRTLPNKHLHEIKEKFKELKINALLIVGGFEAYHSLVQLTEARKKYEEFCIPMVLIPATMSNNVPGSWFALGADTTLNVIVECCDRLLQSAGSSADRVFIVETMGGKCGYLATMAAIASGADAAYIFEEKFTLADLKKNISHLIDKFKNSHMKRGLVLRAEHCNDNYTTDFITCLYREEGKGVYSTRTNILGHVQQGGFPTPFDRLIGTRHAVKAFNFLLENIESNIDAFGLVKTDAADSSCVLGHIKNHSQFTPVQDLIEHTDFPNRLPSEYWWASIRPLLRILARYEVMYYREIDEESAFQGF